MYMEDVYDIYGNIFDHFRGYMNSMCIVHECVLKTHLTVGSETKKNLIDSWELKSEVTKPKAYW